MTEEEMRLAVKELVLLGYEVLFVWSRMYAMAEAARKMAESDQYFDSLDKMSLQRIR